MGWDGCSYAVRRLAFSPHAEPLLLSCSYDMSVRLWDISAPAPAAAALRAWEHHSEFAVGVDWSTLREGLVASCGWDEQVAVWDVKGAP